MISTNRIIILIWFLILSALAWKRCPIQADEYYSTFISNGICIGCFWTGEARAKYIQANPCDTIELRNISSHSGIDKTIHCAMRDGANALLYYTISFYWTKWLGHLIGVFNALKWLTFLISGITLWYLVGFLREQYGGKVEVIGGIYFISVSIPNLLFVRTYAISSLAVLIFVLAIIKWVEKNRLPVSTLSRVTFILVVISLPFFHFFNSFILVCAILLIGYITFLGKINLKRAVSIAGLPVAGLLLVSSFYLGFNKEGLVYQKQLSSWYSAIAKNAELPQYKPSIKLNLPNLIKKNIWAGARVTGLKLNHPNYNFARYSIRHISSYILLFVYFILLILFFIYRKALRVDQPFLICAGFISGYFILLNITSLLLGHLVSFNDQYFFILFPLSAVLFSALLSNYTDNQKWGKITTYVILATIMVNSILYCVYPPEMPHSESLLHKEILEMLEKSFQNRY